MSIDGQTISVQRLPAGATANASTVLTLRPEVVTIGPRDDRDITLTGTIADVTFLGSVIRLRVMLGRSTETVTISLASKDLLMLNVVMEALFVTSNGWRPMSTIPT